MTIDKTLKAIEALPDNDVLTWKSRFNPDCGKLNSDDLKALAVKYNKYREACERLTAAVTEIGALGCETLDNACESFSRKYWCGGCIANDFARQIEAEIKGESK